MKVLGCLAACVVATTLSGQAGAATLRLDGYTAPVQSVSIPASPVAGTPSPVGATGFAITDTSGTMGSFTAWCLDIAHWLMSVGSSQTYNVTTTPWSNSYGLTALATQRVQSVFDANYGSVDIYNGDQAAAFQLALWEAAFEADGNALSLTAGAFQANSNGSDVLAASYLANAALDDTSTKLWSLTFLEVAGYGATRGAYTGQNLVTASPVPLPAGGLLLVTALAGAALLRRRRH